MTDCNELTARQFSSRLGFPPRTANGAPSNHSAFLARKAALHPDIFPKPRWLGGRKVYRQEDVERFLANLPTERPHAA